MKNPPDSDKQDLQNSRIRKVAENRIAETKTVPADFFGKTSEEIIHELRVHQIELEIQNEELKKTQLDLEDSRNQYMDLYDFAPIGYITLTKEALIAEVNLTGAVMLGSFRNQLLKARFRKFISPGNLDIWDSFFLTVLKLNKQTTGEFDLIRKDGIGFSVRIDAIRAEKPDGSIQVRIAMGDVTGRKIIEESLKESEKKYRMLIETLNEGIWVIDKNSVTTFVNPKIGEIFGYPREEMIGRSLFSFIPDDGKQICEQNLENIRQGMKKHAEFEFLKIDGTVIHTSLQATPIMSEDGEFLGVIAGVTDITDRLYAQNALHESNQKLRLLTSLTRHDILNQIFVVQILHDEVLNTTDPEKIHRYLTLIREAANQIEATIGFTRDYDDFGVVSSGWQRIRPIIESAKSEISLQKVTIDNRISEDLEVYADPIIRKVFTTLMENAIRHGKDLTRIVFSSAESGGSLLLICEDDGSGIPKEKKDHIFEHGYGDHTGIGLFIIREILTITNLAIHESGEEGKGSRFEILVPNGKYRGLS